MSGPVGLNVFGYVYSENGLGIAARSLIDALIGAGHPVNFVAVAAGDGWDDPAAFASLEPLMARTPADLVHPVHLLVGPPCTIEAWLDWIPQFDRKPRILAASVFWELDVLPERSRASMRRLDLAIGCTRFVADVLQAQLPQRRVLYSPQPLTGGWNVVRDRARFAIAPEIVTFCCSFNLGVDLERKNPLETIQAFLRAFPGRTDRLLVVKATVSKRAPVPDTLKLLEEAVAGHSNVRLFLEELSYEDVLALYASVDVYLSLHRSEGLGLGILESMLMGTPVIATGYSGNMSYMDEHSAAIVGYHRVPVSTPIWQYAEARSQGASWAQPDMEQAIAWMQRLAEDSGSRRSMGERGRKAALAYLAAGRNLSFAGVLSDMARERGLSMPRKAGMLAELPSIDYSYTHTSGKNWSVD